jgi:hypothetical protein
VGEALARFQGAKSLVLLGYGMGEYSAAIGTYEAPAYGGALGALRAARVAVFALDVTQADQHDLAFGLQSVAEDTGGIYAKTFPNPGGAFRRIAGVLEGHYVLALEKPPLRPGRHQIHVELVPPAHGTVLVKPDFVE